MHHKRPELHTLREAEAMGYRKVVFGSDLPKCDCCGEPWCTKHQMHYDECECIGPTELDVDFIMALAPDGSHTFMGRKQGAKNG